MYSKSNVFEFIYVYILGFKQNNKISLLIDNYDLNGL